MTEHVHRFPSINAQDARTMSALDWNIGQDDPHDHYPWKWSPYLDADGGPELGSITTPNGTRPDGSTHTYWMIAGNIWEPSGRLICRLVNQWAHDQFGTPIPAEDALLPTQDARP